MKKSTLIKLLKAEAHEKIDAFSKKAHKIVDAAAKAAADDEDKEKTAP